MWQFAPSAHLQGSCRLNKLVFIGRNLEGPALRAAFRATLMETQK